MALPNFLLIGAPKCGTSSLYHLLSRHPQIFTPKLKEPHFFSWQADRFPHWAATRTLPEYERLFEPHRPDQQAIGEGSTWYLYGKQTPRRIAESLPGVRLLAILRNPVERAYSAYRFRVKMGFEPLTFKDALAAEAERIQTGADWDFHYLEASRYAAQLDRYLEHFPAHRLKLLLLDDLKANPQAVFDDCCRFLDLPHLVLPPSAFEPRNVTGSIRLSRWKSLVRAASGILRGRARLQPAGPPDRPMDPEIREWLQHQLRSDITRVEEHTGRCLPRWHSSR